MRTHTQNCPFCGRELYVTLQACPYCGRYLQPPPMPPQAVAQPAPLFPPASTNAPHSYLGLLLITGLLIIFFTWGWTEYMSLPRPPAYRADVNKMRERVSFHMSRAQVRAALGAPSHTQNMSSVFGEQEFWYYDTPRGILQICFDFGGVTAINNY